MLVSGSGDSRKIKVAIDDVLCENLCDDALLSIHEHFAACLSQR